MSEILDLNTLQQATREGRILVAHCQQCGAEQAMPAGSCFRCGAEALTISQHNGAASLYSWSVTGVAFEPELGPEVPYVVAVVRLTGGAKIWARIIGIDPASDALRAELALTIDTQATRERGYLAFRPAAKSQAPSI